MFLFVMALDDILLEAEEKMMKTEEVVQHEFAGVRTGKASPALVENILVEVYGSQMRIRELAGITTPEPRMILIQPWEKQPQCQSGGTGKIHPDRSPRIEP
jgi:ribosome recycling factor